MNNFIYVNVKVNSPFTGLDWPRVSRMLSFPDFMTMVQDGGKFDNLKHRPPLPTGNDPGTHLS